MSQFLYEEKNKLVYKEIKSRLEVIGINIEKYIKNNPFKREYDIDVYDTTLDGIKFTATDAVLLKSAFNNANDLHGKQAFASMKSAPDNWALKCSFGATSGIGWREIWRPIAYQVALEQTRRPSSKGNNMFWMRSGSTSIPFNFTSLHCSLNTDICKIHIDKSGFVMDVPFGISLTPDFYQHTANELLFKSKFRDWLVGKIPYSTLADIVKDVIDGTSFVFPNAANGFAGLERSLNSLSQPKTPLDGLKTIGKIVQPIGLSFDLYNGDKTKVQADVSWLNGEQLYTINFTRLL